MNSARGVWAIAPKGQEYLRMEDSDTTDALIRADNEVRSEMRKARMKRAEADDIDDGRREGNEDDRKDILLNTMKAMDPTAFERLSTRLLREAGFRNVEVLGRSGDGGIDGVGVYKVSLVSFPTYFQSKRYAGSISAEAVRDFRGAMSDRGEKGLIITTCTFTPSAKAEATRDGAPPVDLVDGDELCELLKDFGLGVHTERRTVEDVTVDVSFFDGI
jgi:restriction system protein